MQMWSGTNAHGPGGWSSNTQPFLAKEQADPDRTPTSEHAAAGRHQASCRCGCGHQRAGGEGEARQDRLRDVCDGVAGGALASLAHVPFIGNALTASAKAPEAWGYALGNMANAFWSQSALEPTLDDPAVGAKVRHRFDAASPAAWGFVPPGGRHSLCGNRHSAPDRRVVLFV